MRPLIPSIEGGKPAARTALRSESLRPTPSVQIRRARATTCVIALLALLNAGAAHAALFLDLTSVTPGSTGTGAFTGTLGAISVTGSILAGPPASFSFNAVGAGIGGSTTAGTSPQYSYPTVYDPIIPLTDRVGFTSLGTATNTVTISFSSAVTNPVFHFANMDWAQFNFGPTPGLTGLTLLNGNAGGGDGVDTTFGGAGFGFKVIQDASPGTSDATPPGGSPPTAGARSAYGSVQLNGTMSTIVFGAGTNGPFSDDGSFTISVPEPGSALAVGMLALVAVSMRKRRARASS